MNKNLVRKENLIDQYEDSLFAILMDRFAESEGLRLIQENNSLEEGNFELPDGFGLRFEKIINDIFAQKKHREKLRKVKNTLNRVAIILVACGIIFTTLFSTVSAFREKVYKLISINENINTDIYIDEANNKTNRIEIPSGAYLPSWLPDGYTLYSYNNMSGEVSANYIKNSNTINYYEHKNDLILGVDTESADSVEETKIKDYDGLIVIKGNLITISWYDTARSKIIRIRATALDKETVLKIAQSVEIYK